MCFTFIMMVGLLVILSAVSSMLFIRIWATLKQLTKSEVAGELHLLVYL